MLGILLLFLFGGLMFFLFFVVIPIQSKREEKKYEIESRREVINDLLKNYAYGYIVYANRYPWWREEDFRKHKDEIKALHRRLKADLDRKMEQDKIQKAAKGSEKL